MNISGILCTFGHFHFTYFGIHFFYPNSSISNPSIVLYVLNPYIQLRKVKTKDKLIHAI